MFQAQTENIEQLHGSSSELFKPPFIAGHWGQCLELLQHLCQYSDNIILVSGVAKSGKTTLLRSLLAKKLPFISMVAVQGRSDLTVPDLMEQIAKGFNLPWKQTNGQNSEKLQEINTDQPWVLMIDDASKLTNESLIAILKISKRGPGSKGQLHTILFGDQNFEERLNILSSGKNLSLNIQAIDIEPFQATEVEGFLNHKWAQAGNHTALPFDRETIDKIYHLSSGVPGEIERLARLRLDGEEIDNSQKSKFLNILAIKKIFKNKLVLATLVTGLLLGFVSIIMPEEQHPEAKAVHKIPVTVQRESSKPTKESTAKKIVNKESTFIDEELKMQASIDKQREEQSLADMELKLKLQSEFEEKFREQLKENAEQYAMKEAKLKKELEQQQQIQTQLEQKLEQEHKMLAEQKKLAEDLKVWQAKQNQHKAAKTEVVKTNEEATVVNLAVPKSKEFIYTVPKQNYTLQLIALSNKSSIELLIKQHNLGNMAKIIKVKSKEKILYLLVYGNYNTREEALHAVTKLPGALTSEKPWVRDFASILKQTTA